MRGQSFRVMLPLMSEADTEARQLGHSWIGPEHLLLAVAANARGASRTFLDRHGMTPEALRESVVALLGPPIGATEPEEPLTIADRSHVALADAVRAGKRRGELSVAYAPDDLLLALLTDDVALDAVVGAVFERAGLTPGAARAEVAALSASQTN